jgi:hypothetical protein
VQLGGAAEAVFEPASCRFELAQNVAGATPHGIAPAQFIADGVGDAPEKKGVVGWRCV